MIPSDASFNMAVIITDKLVIPSLIFAQNILYYIVNKRLIGLSIEIKVN